MKRYQKLWMGLIYLLLIAVCAALLTGAIGYRRDGPTITGIVHVTQVEARVDGGPWETVTLPHRFDNLAPRTPVTIRTTIRPRREDAVYLKMVYSPADVYLNDRLVFTFGKEENYPAYMQDPATEIHMVETNGTGEDMALRLEIRSPKVRDHLMVHPLMVGTTKELILERSRTLGLPFVFATVQIVGGVSLALVSLLVMLVEKKGRVFLWLALFSLTTGLWAFGENNFSAVLTRSSTLLYLLSFIGLFTFLIPLAHFTRVIVEFENPMPLWLLEMFCACSAAIALLLQLLGLVSCAQSMYFFQALLPPALLLLMLLTVREFLLYRNLYAKRFILPLAVLAASGVLELFNYRNPVTWLFSSLFQLGTVFFLLFMGVVAGLSIKDSLNLKRQQKELAFEQNLLKLELKEQESSNRILAQHEALVRQQRHDLRHHLAALEELARQDQEGLMTYLHTLQAQIPAAEQSWCENRAVHAVVSHYAALCREQQIALTVQLAVPAGNPHITDSELCVIFGNLLENAVEACGRMTGGERKICLYSSLQYDMLTITMDNSFEGEIRVENGRYRSSKREDYGIGLSSIRSVARKAGGDAEFRSRDRMFQSSVYVNL